MGEWVDLSQPFTEDMHPAKLHPEMAMQLTTLRELDEEEGKARLQTIRVSGHQGTHIDTPAHVITGGQTVDRFGVDRFVGRGAVLDVQTPMGEPITKERLQRATPEVRRGEFVVLYSGADQHHLTEEYFDNPYLENDAAEWLVDQGITLIGHDMISVDVGIKGRGPDFRYPVHKIFLGNDVLMCGQLINVGALAGHRAELVFLPLNVVGADGSPVRAAGRIIDDGAE